MYQINLTDASYSDKYNDELSRFVSSNAVEMLNCYMEIIEDSDFNLKFLFPEAYVDNHSQSECLKVLKTLRDRMQSSVFYDSLSPLQEYVLYNTIEGWIDLERSLDIDLHRTAPDYLKALIKAEDQEPEYVLSVIEDLGEYADIFFKDTDFDSESLRGFVQLAIHNPERFLKEMSFEDLDQYIEVMPADVAEEYQEFREKIRPQTQQIEIVCSEDDIVKSVYEAMKSFARRLVDHKDKGEVVLTRDLHELLVKDLTGQHGVTIAREHTLGRAAKTIGETDLYFYMCNGKETIDIAVLENKVVEKFKDQYLQLMGYLNPYFKFGMTVSINKKLTIDEAEKKIIADLRSITGDFAVTDVYQPKNGEHYLLSEHIVPETKKKMRVYHFILNLSDECRANAAEEARK